MRPKIAAIVVFESDYKAMQDTWSRNIKSVIFHFLLKLVSLNFYHSNFKVKVKKRERKKKEKKRKKRKKREKEKKKEKMKIRRT